TGGPPPPVPRRATSAKPAWQARRPASGRLDAPSRSRTARGPAARLRRAHRGPADPTPTTEAGDPPPPALGLVRADRGIGWPGGGATSGEARRVAHGCPTASARADDRAGDRDPSPIRPGPPRASRCRRARSPRETARLGWGGRGRGEGRPGAIGPGLWPG